MDYTFKLDGNKIHFYGLTFGYGVGQTLELIARVPEDDTPRAVVAKKRGCQDWASRGQTSYYPAEYLVLEVTGPRSDLPDLGWLRAKEIISFPVRKRKEN